MESLAKKPKRNTDFSIRSLIDDIQHSTSTSNESLQYSPTSSGGSSITARLSWSNKPQWLPDAEIIDKARKFESYIYIE
jgi:hypothetical protein